jgi:hypothetical protein
MGRNGEPWLAGTRNAMNTADEADDLRGSNWY